ncbi:MAG TPA: cytochrome c [Steroidobacteraceae bacterium]|nr:cytochrome c [Steroidobacteraceae bacterium]
MRLERWPVALLGAAALIPLLWAGPSSAQDQPLKGDPVHGKAISYTCLGCHGVEGYRNAYPNYSVPRLVGQHPEYIVAALQEYKAGQRSHVTMHNQASSLSDQDMADIAAYFAGKPLEPIPVSASDPPPPAATLCAACHGATGVSAVPNYPNLAGQHEDYLRREIEEYKDGGRRNPIMSSMAATIKDSDVDILAAYFSRQHPGLGTLRRPTTILTVGR